jgi:hypothetical protein
MASQQQQIVDTIFNMKRKLLRKDDSEVYHIIDLRPANRRSRHRRSRQLLRRQQARSEAQGSICAWQRPRLPLRTSALQEGETQTVTPESTAKLTCYSASIMPATSAISSSVTLRDSTQTEILSRLATNMRTRMTLRR